MARAAIVARRRLKRLHHGRRSAPGTLAARGGAEERRQNKQKHGDDRFILYKTATLANFRPGNAHMKELIDPHTALNPNPNRGLYFQPRVLMCGAALVVQPSTTIVVVLNAHQFFFGVLCAAVDCSSSQRCFRVRIQLRIMCADLYLVLRSCVGYVYPRVIPTGPRKKKITCRRLLEALLPPALPQLLPSDPTAKAPP